MGGLLGRFAKSGIVGGLLNALVRGTLVNETALRPIHAKVQSLHHTNRQRMHFAFPHGEPQGVGEVHEHAAPHARFIANDPIAVTVSSDQRAAGAIFGKLK
jgi:hypothetical protein